MDKNQLKSKFATGTKPTGEDFSDLIEAIDERSELNHKHGLDDFNIGTHTFMKEVNGDFWITSNAYYDDDLQQWLRVDESKSSFAFEMQGNGTIAYEVVAGVNLWRAVAGSNPIGAFGTFGGWELATVITGHANMVVGGMNFEIDGSNASPAYGRINQTADGTYFSRNAYYDGVRFVYDKVTEPAMAIKIDHINKKAFILKADKGAEEDIDYDGTGEAFPTIEWEEFEIKPATATDVSLIDVGNYFSAENLEDVVQEIAGHIVNKANVFDVNQKFSDITSGTESFSAIRMIDSVTEEPYIVKIANGELVVTKMQE